MSEKHDRRRRWRRKKGRRGFYWNFDSVPHNKNIPGPLDLDLGPDVTGLDNDLGGAVDDGGMDCVDD